MAYQLTTATSLDDILNTIATFATGLGWTVNRNNTFTSGSNTRRILTISRAGVDYAHFASELSTTKLTLHTMRSVGISTGVDLLSQPNRSTYSWTNLLSAGPYVNFWLFGESGSNPYIHCVIEHASGRYRHFGIGELIKKGTWTGGSYCYGTFWSQSASFVSQIGSANHYCPFDELVLSSSGNNGSIRCDECDAPANNISGVDNRYLPYDSSYSRSSMTGPRGNNANSFPYVFDAMGLQDYVFSNYNQRSHLIHYSHFITAASGYYRFIGEPPAIRAANINPFQAGEEFTVGSDTWKIFPLIRKGVFANAEMSDYLAIAYKKVA